MKIYDSVSALDIIKPWDELPGEYLLNAGQFQLCYIAKDKNNQTVIKKFINQREIN